MKSHWTSVVRIRRARSDMSFSRPCRTNIKGAAFTRARPRSLLRRWWIKRMLRSRNHPSRLVRSWTKPRPGDAKRKWDGPWWKMQAAAGEESFRPIAEENSGIGIGQVAAQRGCDHYHSGWWRNPGHRRREQSVRRHRGGH